MKKMKKALLMVFGTVCLIASTMFVTLAYLTDTAAVTNTFTDGKVGLSLDEAAVNEDGTYKTDHDNRVVENNYHLLPGRTYIKDPTVTVDANSEDAYVRMMVNVKNINKLKEAFPEADKPAYYNEDVFLVQMLCVDEDGKCTWNSTDWKYEGYTENTDKTTGITTGTYEFRYKEIVGKSASETVLSDLFTHFTVPGEIDNSHLEYLDEVDIVVNAHAIQAAGFETDEEGAWAVFK